MRTPNNSLYEITRWFLISFCALGIASCTQKSEPKQAADLVITGARVIDPGSKAVVDVADVVIDEGRIVAVGKQAARGFNAEQTIDGAGKHIVPAFADMHVHWGNGTIAESENLVEQTLARNLYYGVTRILNMGSNAGSPADIDSFRSKLADGSWQGPKLYAVGTLFTVPGSHPTTTIFPPHIQQQIAKQVAAAPAQGPIDLMPLRAITLVRSVEDVRTEVKRLATWGADAIKLTIESGPGPFGDDHPQMSEEIVRAAVEEARAASIPVIAHVSSRDELDVCLRTGVDAAAHAIISGPIDGELHKQMAVKPFFYVATLDIYDGFVNWSRAPERMNDPFLRETLTDQEAASMQGAAKMFAREQAYFGTSKLGLISDHVRDAQRAGAVLLTGTDTGNPFAFPGYGLHQELRLMVQAGVAPMDALAAATTNAALFFKEEEQWGAINAGHAADLLILDADPLADIMNTRRISHVIQNGVVIDRTKLRIR
ncbi:MAG TPA: amidohydrolase family protein [Steroidobacteraceae bacterium]|nr:amidohydrolase family protein [Steroidobacteraceae bacterium]